MELTGAGSAEGNGGLLSLKKKKECRAGGTQVSRLDSVGGLTASAQGCYKVLFPGGPLAQLVEHLTLNQKVLGSIPRRLTN